MSMRLIAGVSLGGRYWISSLLYGGMTLVTLGLWPEVPQLQASGCGGSMPSCPEGYYCCHGTCISEDYVCCDDGTTGPGDSCVCCTGCTTSQCYNTSTVACYDMYDEL